VGPYSIKVIDPSRKFVLTRNPKFNIPGLPKGHVDKITGVVTSSVPRMTQDVISGKMDFMTEDPTGDLLPQVRQKYPDRIREDTNPPNTYYFFLNVSLPPFNKLEARQAVNYALDSRALVRVFGGRLQPGCTFLPPGLVGYKKPDCPYGDPNGPGNVAKAKQLVQQSGTKGQSITVYTNNKDPRPAIAQYYTDLLNSIGYKAKTKTLDQQVYFDRIGTKSTKAQTGFTDWFQDFPHPADFFQPLLSADSLQSTPTSNQGRVNDATLNKKIQDLTETPKKLADVAGQWGDLDQYVVKNKAYIAPYGYEKSTSFFSERMNFKKCAGVHAVWKNDWTQFCLK
jgi:peptide/nickel transport system substrate-binding protein